MYSLFKNLVSCARTLEVMTRSLLAASGAQQQKPDGFRNVRCISQITEVGIYKRKQESNKTRKQELDQESDQ